MEEVSGSNPDRSTIMMIEEIYEDWMKETQRKKIKEILKKVKPYRRILDVGCGPGFLEEFLPEAVALDKNQDYLDKIKGEKVLADANKIPFKSEFDTVFAIDIIHLIKNTDELKRVLKKDGQLIVTIFCNKNNFEEKSKWLKNIFKDMKIKEEFIVKTEKEWDYVLVLNPVS